MAGMVAPGAPNPYENSSSGIGAGQTRSATLAAIGIGSAVAGLIGSLVSSSTSSKLAQAQIELQQQTNEQNAFLTREANQWNWQMQQEQNDANLHLANVYNANQVDLQNDMNEYNERMWNLANEYNSPANQLALARQAGINPNAALGFGNVQPVQQVSAPSQALSQGDVSHSVAPQMRTYDIPKGADYGQVLRTAAEALQNWPLYREQLAGLKEDNRRKRLENDAKEDANNIYKNALFVQNPHDAFDIISSADYDSLSAKEKENYQIDGMPNMVKMAFDSKDGYDAYVDLLNFRRNLSDASADISQSRLRKMIADGQIESSDALNALIDMPKQQYDNLVHVTQNLIQEIQKNKDYNADSGLRHEQLNQTVEILKERLTQMKDTSLTQYIEKWSNNEFEWSDIAKILVVLAAKKF